MTQKTLYICIVLSIIGIICWGTFSNLQAQKSDEFMEIIQNELSLKYVVQEPAKGITKDTKTLILLHGVGSNEADLFRLREQLPKNLLIISAQAPIKMGNGRYAWYLVDFSTGKPLYKAEEASKTQKVIIKFIDEIIAKYNIKHENLYLLGFSQGAIMSLGIALVAPEKIKGALALSGRILKEDKDKKVSNEALKHLKIMIGHGTDDKVLPIFHARESKDLIESLAIDLIYKEYPMGHQINNQELQDVITFLE